jgi:hypothetical protein
MTFRSIGLVYRGEAHLRSGELRNAAYHAWALWMLGQAAAEARRTSVDVCAGYYGEAFRSASTLGMRPLVAHCHLGLGKLYRRTGKEREAKEHLTTARMMDREMGMPYWLEQAEAEMKELS